jgi:hypothetical protein
MPCLAVGHDSRFLHTCQLTRKNHHTISHRCEFCGFHGGAAEYSVLVRCEAATVGNRIRPNNTCRPVQVRAVLPLETSGCNYPLRQRRIIEERNPHFLSALSFHFDIELKVLWSRFRNYQFKLFQQLVCCHEMPIVSISYAFILIRYGNTPCVS